jgi:hypothetical protein
MQFVFSAVRPGTEENAADKYGNGQLILQSRLYKRDKDGVQFESESQ